MNQKHSTLLVPGSNATVDSSDLRDHWPNGAPPCLPAHTSQCYHAHQLHLNSRKVQHNIITREECLAEAAMVIAATDINGYHARCPSTTSLL